MLQLTTPSGLSSVSHNKPESSSTRSTCSGPCASLCVEDTVQQKGQPVKGRIDLGDVTIHNIKQLKRLNQVVFPVAYNDKFYKDVLEVGELAKLAYFNDIVVGAVCCREDKSDGRRRLYIMTLGCLAPYRRLGIGSKMLEHVLKICEKDGNYDNVYLHVQVNNEDAVKFYEHFGFEIVERNENYYKRIEPADAFVLQKTFKNGPSAGVKSTQSKDIMEDSIENKENIINKKS